ncbi:MAG TPA: SDR family NAD(P)-dependent oxidoreductase [Candidatus Binataceae bacterium]|nr:SDR family NAD(P)-dependent oxidoreductase [Candidatus Binataceae bacterium]
MAGHLEGKVAAVTGGGRGIGREVSKALARQGAAVVVNDLGVTVAGQKETVSPADDAAKEIKAAGGNASSNHMDISTPEGGEGLVNQAIKDFGKLDILVNVAGILRDRMIFNMTIEEWDAVVRVHLRGHFCTMRPATAHMRERKFGRIINFSSNSAQGAPGQPNYAAAKAGILGLTYSTANAMQKYGVTCNAMFPGAATRMTDTIPAGRMPGAGEFDSATSVGTPRDPANVPPIIVYLCSDEASEVTGQCFGASGYRITRYSHMKPERVLINNGPWDIDDIFKLFKQTLGVGLEPPRMF